MTWRQTNLSTRVRRGLKNGESRSTGMIGATPVRANCCFQTRCSSTRQVVPTRYPHFKQVLTEAVRPPRGWKPCNSPHWPQSWVCGGTFAREGELWQAERTFAPLSQPPCYAAASGQAVRSSDPDPRHVVHGNAVTHGVEARAVEHDTCQDLTRRHGGVSQLAPRSRKPTILPPSFSIGLTRALRRPM